MRNIFIKQLTELAITDRRIFLITGDLGFGVLNDFKDRFPRQYLNAGVAEQNMTGVATGLALEGRIVFTYSIANFPTLRCLEQIRNDACYHNANVKVVAIGGGFSYGQLGMSHHATEDLAILRSIPEITVISPGDDWEAQEATKAVVSTPGCCYLRLDKSSAGNLYRDGEEFVVGKSRVVRDGGDATIIATGGILGVAMTAAARLAERGISVRVVSVHTLKPLDTEGIVAAARDTRALVTLEEHVLDGGLGSAVAEACMDAGVQPRAFRRIGLGNVFASAVGDQDFLRERYGLGDEAVCTAIAGMLH